MSYIFVLAAVALVLLVSAIVFHIAAEGSGSEAAELDAIVDILGVSLDIASVVPIIILIALVVAVLGVWGRL